MNKEQIGFEANNRTPDHLLTIKSIVNKYVDDNNQRVYTFFIDFNNSFPSSRSFNEEQNNLCEFGEIHWAMLRN